MSAIRMCGHGASRWRMQVRTMDMHLDLGEEGAFVMRLRNLLNFLYRAITGPNHHA